MAAIIEVGAGGPDDRIVRAAADVLSGGGLVVIPTETVYGLACRPDLRDATARVFEAKGRPTSLNLPVLAPGTDEAWRLGRPSDPARRLAAAFWPGPLTLVLPRTELSRRWSLGERADTVAVRVPDHPLTLALLEAAGPLAATSANPTGRPPLADADELRQAFDSHVELFLLSAPGEPPPAGVASTVVDCSGPGVTVLREGALSRQEVERAVGADLGVHPNR